jgi:arabinogalactan endo-1,4-beta-galactosidase
LANAESILIAGCGGGFDVFAGVPIAQQLMRAGKRVTFANFSFTNLWLCGGEQVTPTAWRVDERSNEIPYFPER